MRRVGRFLVALTVTAVLAAACGHPQTPQPAGGAGGTSGATTPGQGPVADAGNAVEGSGDQSPVPLGLSPDQSNVKYCSLPGVPDDQEDLDIYNAHGGGGTTPAVLFVHGGGWLVGDKASERPYPGMQTPVLTQWIRSLQDKGILVASINYPLAIRYPMPLGIEGVKCAVRFLRAKAADYHIDPNRIGAFGGSAGGHLVALLTVSNDDRAWDVGSYLDQSSKVQAVVDLFGPTDIALLQEERPSTARFLNHIFQGEDNYPKFSPALLVKSGAPYPPTLVMNGQLDPGVPPRQAQEFYDRLKGAGATTQLVLVKNAGHGFVPVPDGATISPSIGQLTSDIVDWFVQYLR